MREEEEEVEAAAAAEEFSVWKKNSPFLYDLVISHALEWPSLTVQWFPTPPLSHQSSSSYFASHKLLLGTHTSDGAPNSLIIADALLPAHDLPDLESTSALPLPMVSRQYPLLAGCCF